MYVSETIPFLQFMERCSDLPDAWTEMAAKKPAFYALPIYKLVHSFIFNVAFVPANRNMGNLYIQ